MNTEAIAAQLELIGGAFLDLAGMLREDEPDEPAAGYFPAELQNMLSVSPYTVNSWAKRAGVETPKQGERSHRYTRADVVKILRLMAAEASSAVAEAAKRNLNQIEIGAKKPRNNHNRAELSSLTPVAS